MHPLVLALMVWISGETGYPVPDHPKFAFLSPAEIQAQYYGRPVPDGGIVAFVVPRAGRIAVSTEVDPATLRGMGVLVHELAHHMQFAAGAEFDCPALREHQAYALQLTFLEAAGLDDPWAAMDAGPIAVKALSFCDYGER